MISLCMITRDEEHFLARCLSSVQTIVDEIIVVDTGSVDRTKEIAMSFGAQVYDFKWRDDFASARNYAISKAAGSRLFSLDADEVVSGCDGMALKDLAVSTSSGPVVYSFVTRNYTFDTNLVGWVPNTDDYCAEQAGTGWVPSEKIRLFPNQSGIRYEYPVHEMVEPSIKREGIEIRKCSIPIHHYGPLQKDQNDLKMQSYYRLGRIKAESSGNQVVALYELAIQAGSLGKMQEAIYLWREFIALKPDVPEAYVHLGTAYFQSQDYPAALKAAIKALELAPGMKEARYNYCLCGFILGNIAKTKSGLEDLKKSFPQFLPARLVLAAADICSGDIEKGLDEIKQLKRTSLSANLAPTLKDLALRLKNEKQTACANILSGLVLKNGNFSGTH